MPVETVPEAVALLKQKLAEKPLPLDDFMHKQVVDDYLLYWIPKRSGKSVTYIARRVYDYVPDFIRWWADQIQTDALTADDAHNLTERFVEEYTLQKTDRPSSRIAIDATLSAFAKNTVGVFIDSKGIFINPWKRLVGSHDITESVPTYVFDKKELDKFYAGIGTIAHGYGGLTREQIIWRYQNWFKFLLQTGLRIAHAEMFTYSDIFGAVEAVKKGGSFRGKKLVEVKNFMGDVFYPIPARSIVRYHKGERNERISPTKGVMEFVYIHEDLYRDILDLYNDIRPGEDDTLLGVTMDNMRHMGKRIGKRANLKDVTWSLRHTWATVYYIMSGRDLVAVAQAGGWSGIGIPFKHYLRVISQSDAYHIMKDYHIYIDPTIAEESRRVEYGVLHPGVPFRQPPPQIPITKGRTITITEEELVRLIAAKVREARQKGKP